jgi:hypothetical protein
MVSSALELHRYATDRESRVVTAMTMLKSHLFRRATRLCRALEVLRSTHSKCRSGLWAWWGSAAGVPVHTL